MDKGYVCCKALSIRIKNNGWKFQKIKCSNKWNLKQNNHNVFLYCPFCGTKVQGVEIESNTKED